MRSMSPADGEVMTCGSGVGAGVVIFTPCAQTGVTPSALRITIISTTPGYVANMSPPLVKYWRAWNRPISPRGLSSHKTVGFAAGLWDAMATKLVQHVIG